MRLKFRKLARVQTGYSYIYTCVYFSRVLATNNKKMKIDKTNYRMERFTKKKCSITVHAPGGAEIKAFVRDFGTSLCHFRTIISVGYHSVIFIHLARISFATKLADNDSITMVSKHSNKQKDRQSKMFHLYYRSGVKLK